MRLGHSRSRGPLTIRESRLTNLLNTFSRNRLLPTSPEPLRFIAVQFCITRHTGADPVIISIACAQLSAAMTVIGPTVKQFELPRSIVGCLNPKPSTIPVIYSQIGRAHV